MWFSKRLRQSGILNMNRRNAEFIMPLNPRRYYPLVDNKCLTKQLAMQRDIQTPPLYGVVEILHDLHSLNDTIEQYSSFVLKPAQGSGGNGILVIREKVRNKFRKANGELIDNQQLQYHIANVLSGMFSLSGVSDACMIEYCVEAEQSLAALSYQGVPDIRTIVYKGVPIMAMLRLPTQQSDGKANLHQGAVGVGVEPANGLTHAAIFDNKPIEEHPDIGVSLLGFAVPHWQSILSLSARCYELTGLAYLGVDIVIDQSLGPLLLELNARPGLSIQLANKQGLMLRTARVDEQVEIPSDPQLRVELAQTLFSNS